MYIPLIKHQAGPKFLAVADAFSEAIKNRSMRPDEQLPPQRELAYALGLSHSTVTRAYRELERRALVYGEVGRGTFVRNSGIPRGLVPQISARPSDADRIIDLSMNLPVVTPGVAHLEKILPKLPELVNLEQLLDYGSDTLGSRHAVAGMEWLGQVGLLTSAEQITLTAGAQHALLIALMATTNPGDALLVEELTYSLILPLAGQLGLTLHPVSIDRLGICPDDLERKCKLTGARVLYTMPTLHSPTTRTMPEERRRRIADLCRSNEIWIIEDDVFGFLPPERPSPLANFLPERTVFITSTSKSLAPWLRIGFMHTPHALAGVARSVSGMTCWKPSPVMAEIACQWICDGTAIQLNNVQQAEAARRQKLAAAILPDLPIEADPHGLHLWISLESIRRMEEILTMAEKRNLKLSGSTAFSVTEGPVKPAIRLSLGAEHAIERLQQGLEITAELLLTKPSDPPQII